MRHTVYITRNCINNIVYVGKHSCQKEKCPYWSKDKECLYLGSGKKLKSSIKSLGKDNFTKIVVADFSKASQAYLMEIALIAKFKREGIPLYNIHQGGQGRCLGAKHNEDTKKILSKKRIGSKLSEATKDKISKSLTGRTWSKEHSENMRVSRGAGYIIEGKKYFSIRHIAEDYSLSLSNIHYRIKRDSFPEWRKT